MRALSDLSVTEFLVLARMGFLPRGLVIGSAVWDAGAPAFFSAISQSARESNAQSVADSLRSARQAALSRMWSHGKQLHAEGVVGVRLTLEHHRWHGGHQVAKIVALGTAIAFDKHHAPREFENAPSLALANGGPFTSDLSGQDFVALLRAGYRPISLATGNAVCAIDPSISRSYALSFKNEEMVGYTQAFFDARESAMDTLTKDIFHSFPHGSQDAPAGVVGMKVEERTHGGSSGFVEFTAIGTAVAVMHGEDPRVGKTHPTPTMVVPLDR
ncbi:MAG: heavy metal-binding domain-containing protein [Polyangiaceae bacterium]